MTSEEKKQYAKRYYYKNKEKIAEKNKQYYINNKESINEKRKQYYIDNKESINECHKQYRIANREKETARSRLYNNNNKEKIAERKKIYRSKNKHKANACKRRRRALIASVKENYTAEDAKFTRELFNNMCFNCNSTENLHIDHHRPLSKGNALTIYNAVILCGSCNSGKGAKNPEDFYSDSKYLQLQLLLGAVTKAEKV